MRHPSLLSPLLPLVVVLPLLPAACGGGDGNNADGSVSGDPIDGGPAGESDSAPPTDGPVGPDAHPAALDCVGQALPGVAADPVNVAGRVQTVDVGGNGANVGNAAIDAIELPGEGLLESTTSAGNGTFTLTVATGGTPIEAYMKVQHESYNDTYLWPPSVVYEDFNDVPVFMLNNELVDAISFIGTGAVADPEKALVALMVIDCDQNPVEGATVSVSPAGSAQIVYASENGFPIQTATSTSITGIAYIFGNEPGEITVDAERSGQSMRNNTITALSGKVLNLTIVGP